MYLFFYLFVFPWCLFDFESQIFQVLKPSLHVCLAGMCFYNFSFISLSKIILSYFNFTYYRGFSEVRIH